MSREPDRFGSVFVLEACEAYSNAQARGDERGVRDIFLTVANRCAQLEIWLDHRHGEAAPPADNPVWADLADAHRAIHASRF